MTEASFTKNDFENKTTGKPSSFFQQKTTNQGLLYREVSVSFLFLYVQFPTPIFKFFLFWGGEFQLCVFFGAWTHLVSAPHFFQVQRSPFCWLVKSLGTDRLFEPFISGFFWTAFSIFYLKDDVHNIEYDLMCMSLYVCIYIHVYMFYVHVLLISYVYIFCIPVLLLYKRDST